MGRYLYLSTRVREAYINSTSGSSTDIYLRPNDDIYADLDNNNDGGAADLGCFDIRDGDNSLRWHVCESGMTSAGSTVMAVDTSSSPRGVYAMSSAEQWFEDLGSAELVDGKAAVAIDGLFAETVSLEAVYHVHLTPLGSEAVLLFVSAKTPTAFEMQGVTLDG